MTNMQDVEVNIVPSFSVVKPGDTIVIGVEDKIIMAEADEMRNRLIELLPLVNVIIVPANCIAVYRPDPKG